MSEEFNLHDWGQTFGPDSKEYAVARVLDKQDPILRDMVMIESNSDSGHEYAVQNGLPTTTWRRAYEGVKPSKGSQTVVKETYGRCSTVSEVDAAIAEKGGKVSEVRGAMLRDKLETIAQEQASKIIYGSMQKDEKAFVGFARRYNSLTDGKTAEHVIDNGGTTPNAQTSIYLIGWGKGKIFTFFPKGTRAGIKTYDYSKNGPIDLMDANGGTYPGYKEQLEFLLGMGVQDWRYGARICNIELSKLNTEAARKALYENFMKAVDSIHNLESCKLVAYCSRKVKFALRDGWMKSGGVYVQQANDLTSSGNKGYANHDLVIDGIPVKAEDAIVHTEEVVA